MLEKLSYSNKIQVEKLGQMLEKLSYSNKSQAEMLGQILEIVSYSIVFFLQKREGFVVASLQTMLKV